MKPTKAIAMLVILSLGILGGCEIQYLKDFSSAIIKTCGG